MLSKLFTLQTGNKARHLRELGSLYLLNGRMVKVAPASCMLTSASSANFMTMQTQKRVSQDKMTAQRFFSSSSSSASEDEAGLSEAETQVDDAKSTSFNRVGGRQERTGHAP